MKFVSSRHFLLLNYQAENVEINRRMRDNEQRIFPSAILNLQVQEVSDMAGGVQGKNLRRKIVGILYLAGTEPDILLGGGRLHPTRNIRYEKHNCNSWVNNVLADTDL